MSKYRLMDATELQADLDENKRQVPRTKPLDDEAATIRFYLDLETQAAAHHPEEAPPPPEPSSGGLPSKSPESRPKPPELPKETPMSKKPRGTKLSKSMDPEERLDALLVHLQQQLKNKLVKNAYSTKVAIRKVCDEHGLAVPAEALPKVEGETPAPKKPGRKKAEPEQPLKVGRRKREVAPPQQIAEASVPRPEPLRISPTATIQGRIQNLRAQLWSLLSDLEVLRPEDRAALTEDLALLDAGAHTAVTLARGVAA